MSSIVYSIDILCGRTDLADAPAIGFGGGDYFWSTSDCQGHKTGIVDQDRISSFGDQCNITYGGEVSAPTSELSIEATSSELLAHLAQNSIRLVGKRLILKKSINGGTYEVERSAPIESIDYTSNTSITINTQLSTLFGSKPLTQTVVNEALLMGTDGENSGLTITKAYGDRLQVSLTQFTNGQSPAIGSTGIDAWVEKIGTNYVIHGLRDLERFDDAVASEGSLFSFSGDGKCKVKNEMYLQKIYNDPDNLSNPTRILLNFNGDSQWVIGVLSQFVGGTLRAIRGAGSGNRYSIVSVETKTYDGVYGDWCVLNKRIEENELIEAGAENMNLATPDEDTLFTGRLRLPDSIVEVLFGDFVFTRTGTDRLRATYKAGSNFQKTSDNENATVFVNGYPVNIYMAPIPPLSAISGVVGYTSGDKVIPVEIPTDSIRVILQDDNYALVQIVPKQGYTLEDDTSITVEFNEHYRSYIDATNIYPESENAQSMTMFVNTEGTRLSSVANNTQLSSTSWIELFHERYGFQLNSGSVHCGQSVTTIYSRIDCEGSISNLSPSDSAVSTLYPLISLKLDAVGTWNNYRGFAFRIRTHVVNEAGMSIGHKEITYGIDYAGSIVDGESLGPFEIDHHTGTFTPGTQALRDRIATGLDVHEFAKGSYGSAKYLYTQIVVELVNPTGTPIVSGSEYTVSYKAQSVGMGVRIDKKDIKALVSPSIGFPINNPVDLIKQVLSDVPGVTLDDQSFADASNAVNTKLLPHGNNASAFYTSDSDTVESVINGIAKGSNVAVIINRDSSISAKWFIDDYRDNKPVAFTFTHNDIIDGSLRINRPGSGYMCTDYSFSIKGSNTDRKLSINSTDVVSFPAQSEWTVASDVSEFRCVISAIVEHGNQQITCFIDPVDTVSVQRPPFIPGMYYLIRTQTTVEYATICRMEGFYYSTGWKLLLTKVAMLDGGPIQDLSQHARISNISTMRQQASWKYLVSSNMEADYYLLARNLWEIARRARDFTQTVIALPYDYAQIKQPLWTTAEGWANHMLYTVAHTGFAKTIIEFEAPIESWTTPWHLLDYVEIAAGPYAVSPTKGWIVSWNINPGKGTYTYKILTAVSDEDTLYLDENHTLGLNAQMVIDETVTGSIIDEGVI